MASHKHSTVIAILLVLYRKLAHIDFGPRGQAGTNPVRQLGQISRMAGLRQYRAAGTPVGINDVYRHGTRAAAEVHDVKRKVVQVMIDRDYP